ncbi:MAG: hypothetical protein IJ287_09910 [Methanobrevibacter sp.]|nr:hypothetical protein [Methanobrevibacter sp.]
MNMFIYFKYYITYERLEGKSQILVQPIRPHHHRWRLSMKLNFIGQLGDI